MLNGETDEDEKSKEINTSLIPRGTKPNTSSR